MSGSVLKKYLTMENLQRWAGAAAVAVGLAAPAVAADSPSGLRGTPDPNLDCKEVTVKQAAKPATPAVRPVRPKPAPKPAVAEGGDDKPKAVVPKKPIHRPKPAAATPEKTMWECHPKPAEGTPLQSYPEGGPTSPFAQLVPGFKPGAPLPPFLRPPVAALPPSGGTPLPPTSIAPPLSPPPPRDDVCVNLDNLLKDKQGQYRLDKVAETRRDSPKLAEKCDLPNVPVVPNVPPIERPRTPTDGPQIPPPPRDDIPNQVPEPGTLALVGAAAAALLARRPGKAGAVIKKAFD